MFIISWIAMGIFVGVPIGLILYLMFYAINKNFEPKWCALTSIGSIAAFTMCLAINCNNKVAVDMNYERNRLLDKGYHIYDGTAYDHYREVMPTNDFLYYLSIGGIIVPAFIYIRTNRHRKNEEQKTQVKTRQRKGRKVKR